MSKEENIKSHIDTLRAVMLTLITAIFGICAYAIINIDNLTIKQMISGAVALVIVLIAFFGIIFAYLVKSKELEKM